MFKFKQLEGRSLKNIRALTGFEPVTSAIPVRAMLDQLSCEATHSERRQFFEFISSRAVTYAYKFHIILLYGKIGTALWSHTLGARSICWVHIFPCSEMIWNLYVYIIEREDMNSTKWPYRQCVVHSTVGRASHPGIAEVTGSNSVEAPNFFRLLTSNCLNWNIYCDDHSSNSSITAIQIFPHSVMFATGKALFGLVRFSPVIRTLILS